MTYTQLVLQLVRKGQPLVRFRRRYEANVGWELRSFGAPTGEARCYEPRPSYGSPASDVRPRAQVVYGAGTAPWGNAGFAVIAVGIRHGPNLRMD